MQAVIDERTLRRWIAANIRQELKRKRWRAADLSRHTGLPYTTIAFVLNARSTPGTYILKKIALALETTMDHLTAEPFEKIS
jgi:transcriptional regulator with XRE-family HTH domain